MLLNPSPRPAARGPGLLVPLSIWQGHNQTQKNETMNTIKPIKDKRYTINKEFCGHKSAKFVLRFCGDFVAQSSFYDSLLIRAIGHQSARNGALVFEAIED